MIRCICRELDDYCFSIGTWEQVGKGNTKNVQFGPNVIFGPKEKYLLLSSGGANYLSAVY